MLSCTILMIPLRVALHSENWTITNLPGLNLPPTASAGYTDLKEYHVKIVSMTHRAFITLAVVKGLMYFVYQQ